MLKDLNFSCCIYVMFNETHFMALSNKKTDKQKTLIKHINMYIMNYRLKLVVEREFINQVMCI